MTGKLGADLPRDWHLMIRERSAGVYEVVAKDPWGRSVSTTGTDLPDCVAEVVAGAHDVEAQLSAKMQRYERSIAPERGPGPRGQC